MGHDPVLDELYEAREGFAAKHGDDLSSMFAEWRELQARSGRPQAAPNHELPASESALRRQLETIVRSQLEPLISRVEELERRLAESPPAAKPSAS